MANASKILNSTPNTAAKNDVEVLYQKMGNRWFAFSLVGDEVYVGSLTEAELDSKIESGAISRAAL